MNQLLTLPPEVLTTPAQVFEVYLCGVKPKDEDGDWPQEVNNEWHCVLTVLVSLYRSSTSWYTFLKERRFWEESPLVVVRHCGWSL